MYRSDSSFSNASSLELEASSTPEPQAFLHDDFHFPSQPLDILGVNFDEAWYEAGQALYRIIQRIAEIEEDVYSSSSSVHTLSNALVDTSYELSTIYRSQPELHGSPTSDTEQVSMRSFTHAEKIPEIYPNDSISRENDSISYINLRSTSLPLQGQTRVLWHSSLKAVTPVEEKEIISSTTALLCTRCKRSMDTKEKFPFKRSKSF